jgi:hypothetical protein
MPDIVRESGPGVKPPAGLERVRHESKRANHASRAPESGWPRFLPGRPKSGWPRFVVDYVCRDRADHLWQFGMRSKPARRPRRTAVRGCMLMTRGNLAARHADCARLVDQSGKKGWQKLNGPQRGQVHLGLSWQDAVRPRPSSRKRAWPPSILRCRSAAGPCRSQSRSVDKMGVKMPKKGGELRLLRGNAT